MNRRLVITGFIAALGIVSWFWLTRLEQAPPPSAFVGSTMVYGGLGFLDELAPGLAGAMAVGWTLGLLFYVTDPENVPPPLAKAMVGSAPPSGPGGAGRSGAG
jgi:hypothetical protein